MARIRRKSDVIHRKSDILHLKTSSNLSQTPNKSPNKKLPKQLTYRISRCSLSRTQLLIFAAMFMYIGYFLNYITYQIIPQSHQSHHIYIQENEENEETQNIYIQDSNILVNNNQCLINNEINECSANSLFNDVIYT